MISMLSYSCAAPAAQTPDQLLLVMRCAVETTVCIREGSAIICITGRHTLSSYNKQVLNRSLINSPSINRLHNTQWGSLQRSPYLPAAEAPVPLLPP